MNPSLSRRIPSGAALAILALLLAAGVVAGRDDANPDPAVVQPAARAAPAAKPDDGLPIERLQRTRAEREPQDLFAASAPAVVAAAKPAAPVAPPAPSAPPLPFRYLGRMADGEAVTFFLAKGEDTVAAKVGDVLENQWRLDSASPSALSFTYLPLQLVQPLALPALP